MQDHNNRVKVYQLISITNKEKPQDTTLERAYSHCRLSSIILSADCVPHYILEYAFFSSNLLVVCSDTISMSKLIV